VKRKLRTDKSRRHLARKGRVVKKVRRGERPELCVFRSSKHIYAQLLDGESGRTLCTVSSRSKNVMGDLAATGNVEAAKRVGAAIAAAAKERRIEEVVFNRNGFLYHGRVKALADAAREAGLRF